MRTSTVANRAWVGLPVAVALVAYWRVLHGYFYGDDFLHFYEFVNEPLGRVLARPYAGHLYVIRNLAFVGLYQAFGMWAPPYFALMLALHLTNVALLFVTIRKLTGGPRLASVAAAAWGAAPVHAATLAWFSVFGALLALALSLLVFHQLARCAAGATLSGRRAAALSTLLVAGATCFGTGIATAMVSPLLVLLLVPRSQRAPAAMWWFWAVPPLVATLYLACSWYSGDRQGGVVVASLGAWSSVGLVLQMLVGMCAKALERLALGPLVPHDVAWGRLAGYGIAACTAVLLAVAWWRAEGRERAVSAAFLLAALGQYVMIAAGRATVYQLMAPRGFDNFFAEPRYHYGPMALLAVACAMAVHTLSTGLLVRRRFAGAATLGWFVLTLAVVLWRPTPIDERPQIRLEVAGFQRAINDQIDQAHAGDPVYVPNRPFAGIGILLETAANIYPGWAATFTVLFDSNTVRGHRVFFVEPNAEAVAAARQLEGSRIADILVERARDGGPLAR